MRTALVALAALGLATASPSFAQQAQKTTAQPTVSVKDPANPTHEECKSVMGRKMDGHVMHDHSADKGAPKPPMIKPLSAAEMEKMHAKCAAKMSEAK